MQSPLSAVPTLGDEQYAQGRLKNGRSQYGPTWGRRLSITHPAPGHHEYQSGGDGFFQYFGAAAGNANHPYYSFTLGAWHVIALDGECGFAGGCGKGSPQERRLVADLRAHPTRCTLAFWHQLRFSSGGHGDNKTYAQFWQDLYAAHADLVLNGHEHDYERFAPRHRAPSQHPGRAYGNSSSARAERACDRYKPRRNSLVRSDTFGVLQLPLQPTSYTWNFVPIAGSSFTGTGTCR